MVECSPATRAARVRFPADASPFSSVPTCITIAFLYYCLCTVFVVIIFVYICINVTITVLSSEELCICREKTK